MKKSWQAGTWAVFGLIAVGTACGDFKEIDQNEVVLGTSGGALVPYDAGQGAVWCGPWEHGSEGPQSLHIIVGIPRGALDRGQDKPPSHWRLTAVADKLQVGVPIAFPQAFPDSAPTGVRFFAGDAQSGNEASTAEADSSGSVTFKRAGCSPEDTIEFEVDAVLGSEFGDLPALTMKGTFRGKVSERAPY